MRRDLQGFLFLQIMAAIIAVASFRLIETRWQAALVAGTSFVLLGGWMVIKTLRWPNRFKTFSFYFSRVHLWIFALPMLLLRIRHLEHDFSQVAFLGIPFPNYHKISEVVYLGMVIGTVLDLLRARRESVSTRPSGPNLTPVP